MIFELKNTSKELYLLFYKFSRLMDRSNYTFYSDYVLFDIKNALKVI
jgi:hypothetical protein